MCICVYIYVHTHTPVWSYQCLLIQTLPWHFTWWLVFKVAQLRCHRVFPHPCLPPTCFPSPPWGLTGINASHGRRGHFPCRDLISPSLPSDEDILHSRVVLVSSSAESFLMSFLIGVCFLHCADNPSCAVATYCSHSALLRKAIPCKDSLGDYSGL